MNCNAVLESLDDYLDGSLSEAGFQEVELHLHSCPACREEERLARSLLAQAQALPRELSPSRDLWGGIESRLAGRSRKTWVFGIPALAAAAVVMALLASRQRVAFSPSEGEWREVSYDQPSLVTAEREYAQACATLQAALEAQRSTLSPETQKTVDSDLEVIDKALRSLEGALLREPGNPELASLLISTHRRKLDLLLQANHLSGRL